MARRQDVRRIGVLLPSSSSVQEETFWRVLPDGITLHGARMRLNTVDADSTLRVVEEIETESRKLGDADVDVILLAATAPSSRKGLGYDQELIRRITAYVTRTASFVMRMLIVHRNRSQGLDSLATRSHLNERRLRKNRYLLRQHHFSGASIESSVRSIRNSRTRHA